jgi:hypothetical protein
VALGCGELAFFLRSQIHWLVVHSLECA